ncbi:MAG: hypothetical protein QOI35_800 [Cryptosporangiaceae bacterium]|nr:hypothetical protein [Cryptosporangiaceae bacterium]
MWRCPHCGTPQAETARCWVCKRSSTACGTCRNFRHSVAGSLGFCGLDRRRQPLVGDEIRACWEAWPGTADLPLTLPPAQPSAGPRVAAREFVEVGVRPALEVATATGEPRAAEVPPLVAGPVPMPAIGEPGWSLWGEVES